MRIQTFYASDGYVLHYRHYRPSIERPRGYVVALHGIQSHSGWYEYSSRRMCEAGFDVRFLDRRGSGLNESRPGHAPHYERLINDVAQFLGEVRHERNRHDPGRPVILLAVSWGGKLAAVTAARRPELVDALALLYPGIFARIGPSLLQRFLLKLADIFGKTQRRARIPLTDPAMFTAQSQWQQFIRDDDLALHEATVGFFLANSELGRLAAATPEQIRCPVLLMLAGQDRIIDNSTTKHYFDRLTTPQRKLIEYPTAAHTLEFEPDRATIFGDLLNWLKERCDSN